VFQQTRRYFNMSDPSQPLAGTLHIAVATQDGDVHHALRRPDGTWQPFDLVFRHTSTHNAVRQVNIAMNRNGSGIFALMGDRNILQRIRPSFTGGRLWQSPLPITNGINIDHFAVDATAVDGGIIAVKGAPGSSQFLSASFDRFTYNYTALSTPAPSPDLSTIPIPYITSLSTDFVIAERGPGRGQPIHLIMTDVSGGLYAAERLNAPPFTYPPFTDIRDQAGAPGFMTGADICPSGDSCFVCAVVDDGGLVYTMGSVSKGWTPFADLKAKASDPGAVTDVSVSFFNGAFGATADQLIHVLVATSSGGLYHSTQKPDGTFSPLADVKNQAGDPGLVKSVATDVRPWLIP
jgi:hypothetical protein